MNSSHFMSLGVIPEVNTPTYAGLRNREDAEWYSDTMKEALSGKLTDTDDEYSPIKKAQSNIVGVADNCIRLAVQTVRKRKN